MGFKLIAKLLVSVIKPNCRRYLGHTLIFKNSLHQNLLNIKIAFFQSTLKSSPNPFWEEFNMKSK